FFFSSRRRHTRFKCDWSSDVCSSDLCAQRYLGGRCASLGCRRGWLRIGRTYAALGYKRGDAQRLLLAAKDAAQPGAITLLGRLLAGFLLRHEARSSYDVILPVPFHPRCLRGRPVHPLTAV